MAQKILIGHVKGEDGKSPHIGINGNWWVGTTDTGVKASGEGTEFTGDASDVKFFSTITGQTNVAEVLKMLLENQVVVPPQTQDLHASGERIEFDSIEEQAISDLKIKGNTSVLFNPDVNVSITPLNPAPIQIVEKIIVNETEYTLPQPLANLDMYTDTYDASTGIAHLETFVYKLTSSSTLSAYTPVAGENTIRFNITLPSANASGFSGAINWFRCSHWQYVSSTTVDVEGFNTSGTSFYARIAKSTIGYVDGDSNTIVANKIKNWLDTTSTPVTFVFPRVDFVDLTTTSLDIIIPQGKVNIKTSGAEGKISFTYKGIPYNSKVYGVAFKVIENEPDDVFVGVQRLDAAIGKNIIPSTPTTNGYSDFDNSPGWPTMKLCNITSGGDIVYEGQPEFKKDGTNGDVMVEVQAYYYKREIVDGWCKEYVSTQPFAGATIHSSFIENGVSIPYAYVSAYDGALDSSGTKLISQSSTFPLSNVSLQAITDLAKAKGVGWGLFDNRANLMIETLRRIECADLSGQKSIGGGWGRVNFPSYDRGKIKYATTNSNSCILASTDFNNLASDFFIGCAISFGSVTDNSITSFVKGNEITNIQSDFPVAGETTITFNGPARSLSTSMVIGGAPQRTGQLDSMSFHSGVGEQFGGEGYMKRFRCAVKYRNIENFWGNVWCLLPDLRIVDGVVQIKINMDSQTWTPTPIVLPMQTSNASIGGTDELNFLKNLAYDPSLPWLAIPGDYLNAGISTIPAGSALFRTIRFGSYFYAEPGERYFAIGGGFDHYWRLDPMTYRGWLSATSTDFITYGGRLVFRPV